MPGEDDKRGGGRGREAFGVGRENRREDRSRDRTLGVMFKNNGLDLCIIVYAYVCVYVIVTCTCIICISCYYMMHARSYN